MLSLIRRNSISHWLAYSSSENFTECSIQDDVWQRKKIHRLDKRKQCSAIAAGTGDDHHHHSMLLKEVVGTLTFGEKKREAAAQYSSRTDDPPTTSAGSRGVWWNHDDKERKAAPRGQSLFKLLIFSSLLFSSLLLRTLHGDGRAATVRDSETNSHHRPPMPASGGWMDELDGRMGEWMNGWMDGWMDRKLHFFPFNCYSSKATMLVTGGSFSWCFLLPEGRMDELDRWMGGWMHECMDGRRVDGQEVTLFPIRFQFP